MFVRIAISVLALALVPLASSTLAQAEDSADKAKAVKDDGGKYLDAGGNPTYKIENGTVDWYTFSGYRRYHSDCHVCHGQDGTGSSYAPALANSLKNIDYPAPSNRKATCRPACSASQPSPKLITICRTVAINANADCVRPINRFGTKPRIEDCVSTAPMARHPAAGHPSTKTSLRRRRMPKHPAWGDDMTGGDASKPRVILLIIGALAMSLSNAQAQGAGLGAAGELVDPDILRVCADPSNMPFTDQSGQGFENKLAELVARKTGRKSVAYTWFPTVIGFVRNTLAANRCDVIMGYAQGDELVQNTNAYYRSAYVLLHPKGDDLEGVETIEDPKLAGKRIGVVESTPPTANMAANKLLRTAKIYPLAVDTRVTPSMGEVVIKDMLAGKIDAAILWGPMAGYYAKQLKANVAIVPRPSDQEWKRTLNKVIRENQAEINKLLLDYNVPLIDEHDNAITAAP